MDEEIKNLPPLDLTPIDEELDLQREREEEEADAAQEFGFSLQTRRDERNLAFYLLYAIDRSDYSISLDEARHNFEKGFDVEIPANSFALASVQGVLDKRNEFDEMLKPHLKNWELDRLGCCTRLILYLSLWELQEPGVIVPIVINEAVELAKTFAEKDAYRFINGILDEIFKQSPKPTELETSLETKIE